MRACIFGLRKMVVKNQSVLFFYSFCWGNYCFILFFWGKLLFYSFFWGNYCFIPFVGENNCHPK